MLTNSPVSTATCSQFHGSAQHALFFNAQLPQHVTLLPATTSIREWLLTPCLCDVVTHCSNLPVLAAGGLDLTPLCIIPGKAAWSLYVDALVLNDAGGVLSALSIAALSALTATRLPRVTVTKGGQKGGGFC
jgi:hypothetical protein